jgi:hypothetical protein
MIPTSTHSGRGTDMVSKQGVFRMIQRFKGVGLPYPPDMKEATEAWYPVLHGDNRIEDAHLLWVVTRWQEMGKREWPLPMDIKQIVLREIGQEEHRQRVSANRGGEESCMACAWTGTRYIIRHLLIAKQHIPQPDIEVNLTRFLSIMPAAHIQVEEWAAGESRAKTDIQIFKAACDCPLGRSKINLTRVGEFLRMNPPTQDLLWDRARPIACRQYVVGSGKRYHEDDKIPRAQGSNTLRFFNSPSPEESYGPVVGADIRKSVQAGGSRGANNYIRRKSNIRRMR